MNSSLDRQVWCICRRMNTNRPSERLKPCLGLDGSQPRVQSLLWGLWKRRMGTSRWLRVIQRGGLLLFFFAWLC